MDPRRYRQKNNLTLEAMAKLIGAANASVVFKHEAGLAFPSPKFVAAYQRVTAGKVRYADWLKIKQDADASVSIASKHKETAK